MSEKEKSLVQKIAAHGDKILKGQGEAVALAFCAGIETGAALQREKAEPAGKEA